MTTTDLSERFTSRPRSSRLGLTVLATSYVMLFVAGLFFVTSFLGRPTFPAPSASQDAIVAYFHARVVPVRISVFLSFLAELALGALVLALTGRLRRLGVRHAGVDLMRFAGLAVAISQLTSHLCEWALTWPGLDRSATLAGYYLVYGLGGPGFSVSMGVFVGTAAVLAGRNRLLPGWLVWFGLAVGTVGVLSSVNLLVPTNGLAPTAIPLTRFPSFVWLIVAAAAWPRDDVGQHASAARRATA